MTTPADDAPLGLPDLDPAEPPEGLFERLTAIAVDPSTPPVDDSLIPADSPAGGEEAGGDEVGGDEVDLGDLDDDEDPVPGGESPADDADPASPEAPADSADPLEDPLDDPLDDPLADPSADPFADPATADEIGDPGYGEPDPGHEPDTFHDDLDTGV